MSIGIKSSIKTLTVVCSSIAVIQAQSSNVLEHPITQSTNTWSNPEMYKSPLMNRQTKWYIHIDSSAGPSLEMTIFSSTCNGFTTIWCYRTDGIVPSISNQQVSVNYLPRGFQTMPWPRSDSLPPISPNTEETVPSILKIQCCS